jgi:hypothetical protein
MSWSLFLNAHLQGEFATLASMLEGGQAVLANIVDENRRRYDITINHLDLQNQDADRLMDCRCQIGGHMRHKAGLWRSLGSCCIEGAYTAGCGDLASGSLRLVGGAPSLRSYQRFMREGAGKEGLQ